MERRYNFKMGITVDGNPIPDPAKWSYQVGDLDTSGSRDATGLLHRAYVTTKVNYEFSWNGLDWDMLTKILGWVNKPQFRLVAPDPRTMKDPYEGDYYVGDRSGDADHYWVESEESVDAVFSLKMKFIEY